MIWLSVCIISVVLKYLIYYGIISRCDDEWPAKDFSKSDWNFDLMMFSKQPRGFPQNDFTLP